MEHMKQFLDEEGKVNHSEIIRHLARHGEIRYFRGLPTKWTGTHFKDMDETMIEKKIMQLCNDDIPAKESTEVLRRIRVLWSDPVESNCYPNSLNLENGVLMLSDATLVPHDPKFGFSYMIPIPFDSKAKCQKFKKYLGDVFSNDKDKIRFVQEFFGYCLRYGNPDHVMLWLYGDGRNGKSTLLNILETLLGETNVAHLSLTQTSEQFLSYKLKNKLANIADESSCEDKVLNTEVLKLLSSEGKLTTRQIYQDTTEFRFKGKLIYSLNAIPRFRDFSEAFKERVIILTFKKTFIGKNRVLKIEDQFLDELPGILAWAVRGLQKVTSQGRLIVPESIRNETNSLLDEGNSPIKFINDCCVLKEGVREDKVTVYAEYKDYCSDNKLYATSSSEFWKRVKRKHKGKIRDERPRNKNKTRKRFIVGLRLLK